MKHLSDNRLLELANKVNQGLDFSPQDQRDMLHISACEECYQLLRCMMIVADVTDHIGQSAPAEVSAPAEATGDDSAVIRIVIVNMAAMMEQLHTQNALWTFSEPLALSGTRSAAGSGSHIEKLEDDETNRTYVAYDPRSKTLAVQLDADSVTGSPRASVKCADGTTRDIPLEKRGSVFWGQISGLEEGEYQLILEK